MGQFSVYLNPNPETAADIPYLLDIQNELLDSLATRVVVPLYRRATFGKPARILNPCLTCEEEALVMVTQELAGVPQRVLGARVCGLEDQREQIIAAIDFLISGF
jgi:toxin CcdB